MPNDIPDFLTVQDLVTGYGKKLVLNKVSLGIAHGEIVALIGHNGAGKSTLLKAIFGLLPIWEGQLMLDGESLRSVNVQRLLRLGVSYVPQGNRVFTDLTVYENLEMGAITLADKARQDEAIERAFSLFPALKARLRQRADTLSGGERQMLALANVLILSPRLILLDEPSLGLAPPLVTNALAHIRQISQSSNASVLIVEQKVREVLKIAHRVYVLRNGKVSFSGAADTLREDAKLREVYL